MCRSIFALELLVVLPTILAAQSNGFCLRGKPLPACESFLLFEVGGAERAFVTNPAPIIGEENAAKERNGYVFVAVGGMKNRSDSTAIGGTLEVGAGDGSRRRLALEIRRRTWLSNSVAFDLGAGPLEINTDRRYRPFATGAGYGATSHAALVVSDLVALTGGIDVIHAQRTELAISVGARLGSYPAAGVALVAGALGILVASAMRDF